MITAPVAVFCFNRPAELSRLLKLLEQVKPDHLLVVADGPRQGNSTDVENCRAVEDLYRNLTWNCRVDYLVSTTNLGLMERFSTGLHWVFEKVDRAIILEDDCIPDKSFFSFATEMLERYQNDSSVGMIQGWSLFTRLPLRRDFYFSTRPKVWGWATWRRVVEDFDVKIPFWRDINQKQLLKSKGFSFWEIPSVRNRIGSAERVGTWDYQWVAYLWFRGMRSLAPRKNLVMNIGFGDEASHTKIDFGGFGRAAGSMQPPYSKLGEGELMSLALDRSETFMRSLRILWAAVKRPGTAVSLLVSRLKRLGN